VPEHCELDSHCTQALLEQCGLAVGQFVSPMHWTHPGAFVVPQSVGPPPPSPPPPAASLGEPLDVPPAASPVVPLDVPLDAPLDAPLEVPLDAPLEVPLDAPLEEAEPPSGPRVSLLLELHPTPTANATAMERPRQVLNAVMRAPLRVIGEVSRASSKAGATAVRCSRGSKRPSSN
jgi:hypothetical protein